MNASKTERSIPILHASWRKQGINSSSTTQIPKNFWMPKVICSLDKAMEKTGRLQIQQSWCGGVRAPMQAVRSPNAGLPSLGWMAKTQTWSDIPRPHHVPVSFFTHLSKKEKGTHQKVQQNCCCWVHWGETSKKSKLLQENEEKTPLSSTDSSYGRDKTWQTRKWKLREKHCHAEKEEKPALNLLSHTPDSIERNSR